MGSSYKPLGDYIQEVNVRNAALIEAPLLGVSIKKILIPSIANIIGTDMSTYKLIQKNQFAYGPVTSRNGDKISIALSDEHDKAMVSQAYTVFEVIDENELHPEYLMMWFRRPEFDRYARFMSHGSAREIFSWIEMCDTLLPIPSIEKQREIVKEYNVIQNRILLNNQLITKLEETAQAIYKQWFVDFEFPDENGKPYKSNGGEMVWCEALEKEIPEGWEVKNIGEFGSVITGKTPSSENPEDFGNEMQFITPGDFKYYNKFTIKSERHLSKIGSLKLKSKILPKGTVIVTCIGSDMGKVVIVDNDCITNQQMNSVVVSNSCFSDYLYEYLKDISSEIKSLAMGSSTMPMLSKSEFEKILILKPLDLLLIKFESYLNPFNKSLLTKSIENQKLVDLMKLLSAKMTKVESVFETVEN